MSTPFAHVHFDTLLHISDLHIRNERDRKQEYLTVLDNLLETLRQAKKGRNAAIVITGDLLHVSTRLTPDCLHLTRLYLESLQNLAPTILIPGNHDDNIRGNPDITHDAITTILGKHPLPHLLYLKDTGRFPVGQNLLFGHTSVWDYAFLPPDTTSSRLNIALFHGMLDNTSLPNSDYTLRDCQFKTTQFQGYDLVLLGDVHHHQFLEPHIAYAGSLIQQNHGEDLHLHGGCIQWDLTSRTGTLLPIENPFSYLTLRVQNAQLVDPPTHITPYSRIKLLIQDHTPVLEAEALLDSLDTDILKLTTLCTPPEAPIALPQLESQQTDPLLQYLHEHTPPETLDALLQLHHSLATELPPFDPSKWQLLELQVQNFLGFQAPQTFHFQQHRLSLIFGKNHSGKTSLVRAILFAIYGKLPDLKQSDLFHQGDGNPKPIVTQVLLRIGSDTYSIYRKMTRTSPTRLTTKTISEISRNGKSLETEPKRIAQCIESLFGSIEQIIGTNISLQGRHSELIHSGKSGLLKHLKQILRLDHYDPLLKTLEAQRHQATKRHDSLQGEISQLHKRTAALPSLQDQLQETQHRLHDLQQQSLELPPPEDLPSSESLQTSLQQVTQKIQAQTLAPTPTLGLKTLNQQLRTLEPQLEQALQASDPKALQHAQSLQEQQASTQASLQELRTTLAKRPSLLEKLTKTTQKIETLEIQDADTRSQLETLQTQQQHCPVPWNPQEHAQLRTSLQKHRQKHTRLRTQIDALVASRGEDPLPDHDAQETHFKTTQQKQHLAQAELDQLLQRKDPFRYNTTCPECTHNAKVSRHEHTTQRIQTLQDTLASLSLDPSLEARLQASRHTLSIDKELEGLRLKLEGLRLTIDDAQRRLRDLETAQAQDTLAAQIHTLQDTLQKSRLPRLRTKLQDYTERLALLDKETARLPSLEERLLSLESQLQTAQHALQQNQRLQDLRTQRDALQADIDIHQDNAPILERIKTLQEQHDDLTQQLPQAQHAESLRQQAKTLETQTQTTSLQLQQLQTQLGELLAAQTELDTLQHERDALGDRLHLYELYRNVLSYKGFPLHCIRQAIPRLQDTANYFLSHLTHFRLDFHIQPDGDALYLYKQQGDNRIPLANCSGLEIFLSSICIRMAIPHITQTHGADLFVIDEGFGALDGDYIQALDSLWDLLGSYYRLVLVITHVEALQEKFPPKAKIHLVDGKQILHKNK